MTTQIRALEWDVVFSAQVLRANTRMLRVFHDVGFAVTEQDDAEICHVRMPIKATATYLDHAFERTRAAAATSMRALFEPVVVAVIGASRTRGARASGKWARRARSCRMHCSHASGPPASA